MKHDEDTIIYLKFIKRKRILVFLVRRNMEYAQKYIQLLAKESITSLSAVFSIIRTKEEGCKSITIHNQPYKGDILEIIMKTIVLWHDCWKPKYHSDPRK